MRTQVVAIISWPWRFTYNLTLFVIQTTMAILLFPVKLVFNVLGSWFHASITWTENRLRPLRRRKPLALLFPIQDDDMPTNHDQTDDDRLALRDTGVEDNVDDQQESLGVILDLISFSQKGSRDISQAHLSQISELRSSLENTPGMKQQQEVFKLIQDLQQLAGSERSLQSTALAALSDQTEPVDTLGTLKALESQIGQFLKEQEEDTDSATLLSSDLETIQEEEYLSSRASLSTSPPPHKHSAVSSAAEESAQSDMEMDKALHQLNTSMKQLGKIKERKRSNSNSSEDQQRFMETQQQFQNVIDSLNPDMIDVPSTKKGQQKPSPSVKQQPPPVKKQQQQPTKPPSTEQSEDAIYDILNPNSAVAPSPAATHHTTPQVEPYPSADEIYDPIPAGSGNVQPQVPPITPLRNKSLHKLHEHEATDSDTTTVATPEPRRRRHNSADYARSEEEDYRPRRHSHRHHRRHHHHHHRHHRHRDSSADSRCSYDDGREDEYCSCQSRHHHRPRSRERRHNRHVSDDRYHHYSYRDSSSESRRHSRERSYRDHKRDDLDGSYEEKPPQLASAPNTPAAPVPRESKLSSFLGLFKKSNSLTSLSSQKSQGDRTSVSSYKL